MKIKVPHPRVTNRITKHLASNKEKGPYTPKKPLNTMTINELNLHQTLLRTQFMQSLIDPRRDMDKECGYPSTVGPSDYRQMFDRMGLATRVNNIYPDECWAVDPEVYETDEAANTPFEQKWVDLCLSQETNPLSYLYRLDIMSGIGRYGCLLIGIDDGRELDKIVPGMDEKGEITTNLAKATKDTRKLLFFRVFDESMVDIAEYEQDIRNPRFGRPKFYDVRFTDVTTSKTFAGTVSKEKSISRKVHWSRMIHAADNRECSETLGVPRMQCVFNHLCDIRKILGGSAEMFWKGGFPGISFELNPEVMQAGGIELDEEKLKQQFYMYSNGLQRYLALVGMTAKSLAPQVADPTGNLNAQIQAISVALGVPQRIFTGSEQAQLASGQDVRTWNRRLAKRQQRYLSPLLIRPLVNRLVAVGVMPKPTEKKGLYQIYWPDINMPTKDDQSKIGDRISAALTKYIACQGDQVIPPFEWLTMCVGFTADEARAIIASAKKPKQLTIKMPIPPAGSAGLPGVAGAKAKGAGGFGKRTSSQAAGHSGQQA